MKVITVCNQKGGVGKTTTSLCLGTGLANRGYKVLFIDMDAQSNLSYTFGVNTATTQQNILSLLTTGTDTTDNIINTPMGDIIPSSPMLSNIDSFLSNTIELERPHLLKEALAQLQGYDFVVIDTPPQLNVLTVNSLVASDEVIIPCQADIFSLQGLGQLQQTIESVKKHANPQLTTKGILLTRYNQRSVITRDLTTLITDTAKAFSTKVYDSKIRECTALKEATALKSDIFTYAPKSNASADYNSFIDEYLV